MTAALTLCPTKQNKTPAKTEVSAGVVTMRW
jgi:hypothetical protein